ncbi:MAG: hypothetical protein FWD96_06775, partial [Defluviitaleaceae bacterium]|nr:hypothetical protein [Defluviitaleaceae bacterium]
ERLSMDVLRFCDSKGVGGILIPATTPYVYWDEENKIGKGILSLKHAAVLAGLGIMGRSTIFINRDYGNMVYLGAVLLDVELEQDPPVTDLSCPDGCSICIDNCKQKAIKNGTVDQKLCREHSFLKVGRGWDTYSCNTCRRLCPLRAGA